MKRNSILRLATMLFVAGATGSMVAPAPASAWRDTVSGPAAYISAHGFGIGSTANGDVVAVGSPFIVARLDGSSGQEIWSWRIGSLPPFYGSSVVVDALGDVVVVGVTQSLLVVKLSGIDGSEKWRHEVGGGTFAPDVAIDSTGNVIAAGSVGNDGTGIDGVVAKLDGTSGAELWRYELAGEGLGVDGFFGVKVDGADDVVAAGSVATVAGTSSSVVKLAGATGSQLWRSDHPDFVDSLASTWRAVGAIAVTDSGNVVAEGYALKDTLPLLVANAVVLLSATDGSEVWRHELTVRHQSAPIVPRLGVLPSGNVVASDLAFGVASLAPGDGHELWNRSVGCQNDDRIEDLAVDDGGDVVVAGSASCLPPDDHRLGFTIAKLAGTTGAPVWWRSYDAEQPGAFVANALAVTASGDVAAAGDARPPGIFGSLGSSFDVLTFSGADGALGLCGDGFVDAGEQCDDGNTTDGDCCSATCESGADGTTCEDGSRCTMGDVCQQGTCVGGPALPCEPCGTCDPESGCNIGLPFACKVPTATNKAVIRLSTAAHRDEVRWRWTSGAATSKSEFGRPGTDTGYALCVYGGDSVLLRAAVPATCPGSKRCWRRHSTGFTYRSSSGKPDGIVGLSLRAGNAGRAEVAVVGRGLHLDLPALPITAPVAVQLRKLDGSPPCWSAVHEEVRTNRTHRFVARGD